MNSQKAANRFISLLFLTFLLLLTYQSSRAQLTKVYDFGSTINGRHPFGSPISDGTYLYSTTVDGGLNNSGTIYKIKLDGSGFAKLHDFNDDDGREVYSGLFYDGSFLYGTTRRGGTNDYGTIYKIKTDGTGFTTLYNFSGGTDGISPEAALTSDGIVLYGTATGGGANFSGTVFKINKDGSGFVKLHDFDYNVSEYVPKSSLLVLGGFLYGTTSGGGSYFGTLYKIKTDGTSYQTILNFNGTGNGRNPLGTVISDGTYLYGSTFFGGANNFGTIYKIKPDGTGFVKLTDLSISGPGVANAKGDLVFDGVSTLYGTSSDGGSNFAGTVFKINTNGTGLTKLIDMDVIAGEPEPEGTLLLMGGILYGTRSGYNSGLPGNIFKLNTDGSGFSKLYNFEVAGNQPNGALFSDGIFQYGMTYQGGASDNGTIFKIKPDGTGFVRLLDFNSTNGRRPYGSLTSDGTYLYGMTSQGGINDQGVIFKIKPDGTGYTKLFDFDITANGGYPHGTLIYDAGNNYLYGASFNGGSNSNGIIFKIKTDGSGYTLLYDFVYSNGANPSELYYDGTFIYGTTNGGGVGGSGGWGVIYKIKPDGTGFTKIYDFDNDAVGSQAKGALISDGTYLYGTLSVASYPSNGVIFKIKKDGSAFSKLFDFKRTKDGQNPSGTLFSDGSFLYGTTSGGGTLSNGTIFRIKQDGTGFGILSDLIDGSNASSLISDGTFLYGMTSSGGNFGGGTIFKSTKVAYVSVVEFVPASAVEGTLITIYGNNFDPVAANNSVKFGTVTANVITASSDSITLRVPSGAVTAPVSVTAGTTGTSANDFVVTYQTGMLNGSIQNCNTTFVSSGLGYDNLILSFEPVNPGDKVKVVFTQLNVGDDLWVFNGPDTTSSSLLDVVTGRTAPTTYQATSSSGALTFYYVWEDSGSSWQGQISCVAGSGPVITIANQPANAAPVCAGGISPFTTSASGTTNIQYQWQFSTTSTGTFADIGNTGGYSNTNTSTLSVNTSGNFGAGYYRCKVSGDLATTVFTGAASLVINPAPPAPTVTNGSGCSGTSITLSATGGTNGQYRWYTAATGGSPISGQTNNSFVTPALTTTTTYFVSINNLCESTRTAVTATINPCVPPVIAATALTTQVAGKITLNLIPLITTSNNNLDLTSLQIVTPPSSGAVASIDAVGILTINYAGKTFTGLETITIKACDTNDKCSTQTFNIEVAGDIVVYNGVSPGGNNPTLVIKNIEILPDTKSNSVYIFDRWQNEVWHGNNYDNSSVVFSGLSAGGTELPSGVYYYKINFSGGRETMTGFISLRRN